MLDRFEVTTAIGNYAETTASTATKIPMGITELPSSVQVLNSSFIEDSRAQTLEAIYPYIVGLEREGNGSTDYNLRGFSSFGAGPTARSMQVDGLPGLTTRFGSPNTANIERVEVLKGPASLLYDMVTPGGMINLVTKRPQAIQQTNIFTSIGTYAGTAATFGPESRFGDAMSYSTSIDVTGPVDSGDHLLYRFIAKADDLNSWKDNYYQRNFYLYPSLTYQWDKDTSLTTQVEVDREKRLSDFTGLVTPTINAYAVAPYHTVYATPNDTDRDRGQAIATTFQHNLANGWVLRASERSSDEVNSRISIEGTSTTLKNPIEASTLTLRYKRTYNQYKLHYLDTNLYGDVGPQWLKNTLLFGVAASSDYSDSNRLGQGPNLTPVNIYSPQAALALITAYPPDGTSPFQPKTQLYNYSGYFSDHIKIGDHWLPSFGVRYDKEIGWYHEVVSKLYGTENFGHATPEVALLYLFNDGLSAYGSYSTSFVPNGLQNFDYSNKGFPPETATQTEVGLKAELLNRKVNFTFSAYDIRRTNVLEAVPPPAVNIVGNSYSILDGVVEDKGLELQGSWEPVSNWQMELGISEIPMAKVLSSDVAANVGTRALEVARLNASFWTRYNVPTGPLKGFGAGLGVLYTGPHATTIRVIHLASRTLVNPAIYYQWHKWSVALNVENAFDEQYLANRSQNGNGIEPGDPRTINVSFKTHF